jgi:hypothetical protein
MHCIMGLQDRLAPLVLRSRTLLMHAVPVLQRK